ncbi:Methyl-CpG-binding domain-containing protein 7 [Forsythia ovata]|uniref:Methyl-CpG-binding domain-containing protein 7 n=1 Tax=Forsythia ovata TaxID=205694 RepID=A0ABD1RHD8_9LAMI
MLVPLRPACGDDGWSKNNQLAIVPPTTSIITTSSRFKPPPGWGVEEVLRSNGSHVDRTFLQNSRCRRMIVSGGKMLKLGNEIDRNQLAIVVSRRTKASPYLKLPDGWIVEKVPRKFNGSIDKVFVHFRTLFQGRITFLEIICKFQSFIGRPMKVNWVLASPSGDAWNPMISDILVPDSVKQQWTKRFLRLMNDGSLDSPNSCA